MRANFKFARPVAAAFGLMAFIGVNANAADVVMEEPPAPLAIEELPVASWAGPYAGVSLGYGFAGDSETDGNEIDTDGIVGGAFAGYNWETGGIVAGVEADIGYSGVEGSNAGVDIESGVEGSLRARLGYVVTPDVLLYTTAGAAAKQIEYSDALGSDDSTAVGWTAGVGTDVKITEQVFGRVEYRYTDYGSDSFSTGGVSKDVDSKDHRIQFGVGMKF
ncbi:MAG: porin family protein [Pseudaminobacter sp.]|nr:porin family protein [Pseudaminobacter sp.]